MTAGLMRRLFSSTARSRFALRPTSTSHHLTVSRSTGLTQWYDFRGITGGRPRKASLSREWFTSSSSCPHPAPGGSSNEPPNERNVKLGTTIRTLHDRLPTLLTTPLPQDILSPHITLHLFPSTHPHLPTVSGKLPYTAALWTAPVAWGRVPVIGNIKLKILSERMVKNGCTQGDSRNERLVVKWKTCGKSEKKESGQTSDAVEKITNIVGGSSSRPDGEFSGLFLFEFDEEGRIVNHTIEHVEEGGQWDKPTKVISVTDWLLGRAWGRRAEEGAPSLAFVKSDRSAEARSRSEQ